MQENNVIPDEGEDSAEEVLVEAKKPEEENLPVDPVPLPDSSGDEEEEAEWGEPNELDDALAGLEEASDGKLPHDPDPNNPPPHLVADLEPEILEIENFSDPEPVLEEELLPNAPIDPEEWYQERYKVLDQGDYDKKRDLKRKFKAKFGYGHE